MENAEKLDKPEQRKGDKRKPVSEYTDVDDMIKTRYPQLYYKDAQDERGAGGYLGCGKGWFPLVDILCRVVAANSKRYGDHCRITALKEKFGCLRVYWSFAPDCSDWLMAITESLTDMAACMSGVTCEDCGKPGAPTQTGWIKVLCEDCNKKREEKYA